MESIRHDCRAFLSLLVGLVLACASGSSYALALGEPQLQSHLNEPLKAMIPFTSLTKEEFISLQVLSASPATYRQMGIPYSKTIKTLSIKIKGKQSQRYLELSTPGNIREPLLDLVLKLQTGNGQLLRSFTLMLQPRRF